MRKYRLSTEAFRQRFRYKRKGNESHQDFAYKTKANLEEWLKSAEVYGDHDKVIECFAIDKFYKGISEEMRLWLQDRLSDTNLIKAPKLAEGYETHRNVRGRVAHTEKSQQRQFVPKRFEGKRFSPRKDGRTTFEERVHEQPKDGYSGEPKGAGISKPTPEAYRAFDAPRPVVCYNCKEEGHLARSCKKRVVFASIRESDESVRLLQPYTQEMIVNGKKRRVLRDSAATMDVAHPSCVSSQGFTGE